jgi:DNA-directed RNA polymerase beta subunit
MSERLIPLMISSEERRELIRQKVVAGLKESFPVKSRNKTLELGDMRFEVKDYSPTQQKEAILRGDTLFESVKGTVRLRDKEGGVIDEVKNFTLARVPWFTPRHTLIIAGNEYSVSNQVRPKPGVYARKRANGILEANFNTKGGSNFNVSMDPVQGIPHLEYGSTKIPLYPILRKSGLSHEDIAHSWGKELADANEKKLAKNGDRAIDALYKKVIPIYHHDPKLDADAKIKSVYERYSHMHMDPEVNTRTLGKPYSTVTPHSLLDASGKVLRIFRNADEVDDRDNLDFKAMHSVDDFFKEVVTLNSRDIARKTAIKMEATPELRKVLPSGPFTPGLLKFVNTSQLAAVPTQTNPMELIDAAMRVTSLGEGGISTERAIPMEMRQIHVTNIGALDPFRTPESFRAGIDVRAAVLTKRDSHGNIYVPVYDVKSKKSVYVRAGEMKSSIVAFPNQELKGTVDALVDGVVRKVSANKVRYQILHPSTMYSPTTNLIPFMESLRGNRAVMGSKMQTQALSLVDREEPLVQVQSPTGKSFEYHMGGLMNPVSPVKGTVAKIDADYVYIRPDHKEKTAARREELVKVPYETFFPLAAKTHLNHTLTAKAGDKVEAGQQLGESNFTRNGTLSLGKNMTVAYMPYYGANSNDAVVVSEGAAKKLTSERMYKIIIPRDPDMVFHKDKHRIYYGHSYTKDQYGMADTDGIIKPGTKINPGDPVSFGLRKSQMTADDLLLGRLHKSLVKPFREGSHIWDHDHSGEVIDVVKTPKRIAVTIRTQEPLTVGDKLSGRGGNKGVVSRVVPDDQMVKDENGEPIDVILTSAGIVSRTNPGVILETAVGKVAHKLGKPILIENQSGKDNVAWAKALLRKHHVKDKEDVFDPISGKKISQVFVGKQYMFKLMKSTDTNYSARGVANYDMNQQPTKGGAQSAKAIGKMEFDALVGHNARSILRDVATIKSQKNDEFWRAVQLGYPTPPPKAAFAYDKLLNMMTGAGIRVHRKGNILSVSPLTDKNIKEMSSGEIREPKMVRAKDLKPESGGLFDPAITGGLAGNKWAHIHLAEPVVSPVFRDPVRHLLGLTNPQLDTLIKEKGGGYIRKELAKIDLDKKEAEVRKSAEKKTGSALDTTVKQLKYLRALKDQNLRPEDAYVISHVPVVPPVVRPVLPGKGGQELVYGDINPLYRDLLYVNNQFKEVKTSHLVPGEEEKMRPALHEAVGAVFGVNDPVTTKSRARGHKGFLTYIAGTTSPKYGYFQSKIMKRSQDVSGRGTIVPDHTLGLDEVGIPEEMMWTMYDKFIVRRLVQNGYPALQASQLIKDRSPIAREMLLRETKERPVIVNRAPTLHRYNMVAAYPQMTAGKTIRVHPFIEAGMNADYDGDTMMVHAPVTPKSVEEAKTMTLSNILFSDKSKSDLLVFPKHEAIMGLSHASQQDDKGKPVKFKTGADAMVAYKAGKITLGTRVIIENE